MSYASDRAEIADLMARYLFAMDYHDADAYAECFAEDGVLDYAMGTYGIYEDEFTKASGRWLIAKRRVLNEFLKGRQSGPGNPVADMDRLAAAL